MSLSMLKKIKLQVLANGRMNHHFQKALQTTKLLAMALILQAILNP